MGCYLDLQMILVPALNMWHLGPGLGPNELGWSCPDTPVIALIKYPAVRLTINIQHFLSNKKCLRKYLIPCVHPPSSRQTRKIFLCFVSTPLWIFPLVEASQWALKITLSCLTSRKNDYKLLEKFAQPMGRFNKEQGIAIIIKLHTFLKQWLW